VVGAVYDEVRNLAKEVGCPAWTASQTNSEGDEARVAGGHHVARAREKWANSDVMVSINRTDEEKAAEQVRLHVIKSRHSLDGVTIGPLRSDFGRGRLVALDRRESE
jgi:replicative DNA helicase